MKRIASFPLAMMVGLVLTVAALPAQAECFADYKASRSSSNQLELHYGVIRLQDSACGSTQAAFPVIQSRIARDGWTLEKVLSIFTSAGLGQREASAGEYFLHY